MSTQALHFRQFQENSYQQKCKHTYTINVNFDYDFVTDMLVLEFELDDTLIDVDTQKNNWLGRAGQSLAEALRLAACHELDIEFTELVTGYRVRQSKQLIKENFYSFSTAIN